MGDNVGDCAEAGENKNIDFWVTKKSEKVLVQNWVSSPGGVKEGGVKVAVC